MLSRDIVKFTLFIILVLSQGLMGCASLQKEAALSCTETNWYEIGRREGAQGLPDKASEQIKKVCEEDNEKESALAQLENGRSLGLAEFCSISNGFELGRLGQDLPKGICPNSLEDALKEGYSRGQKASSVEEARRDLYLRIQTLRRELDSDGLSLARRGLLEGERLELESKRQDLDGELTELRSSASPPQRRTR